MSSLAIAVAFLSVLVLSALSLSALALFQAQSLRKPLPHADPPHTQAQQNAALEQMRASLEDLSVQVRDLQATPSAAAPSYRAGLNLSKRSQALRMHRRGEPAGQIATALEIPHQEVELLIKVHRIVLSKL